MKVYLESTSLTKLTHHCISTKNNIMKYTARLQQYLIGIAQNCRLLYTNILQYTHPFGLTINLFNHALYSLSENVSQEFCCKLTAASSVAPSTFTCA